MFSEEYVREKRHKIKIRRCSATFFLQVRKQNMRSSNNHHSSECDAREPVTANGIVKVVLLTLKVC